MFSYWFFRLFFYLFWIQLFCQMCCKHFLLVSDLCSYFINSMFGRTDVSNFDEVLFINLFFHELCFWCDIEEIFAYPKVKIFSPRSFIVLGFMFISKLFWVTTYMMEGMDLWKLIVFDMDIHLLEGLCFATKFSLCCCLYMHIGLFLFHRSICLQSNSTLSWLV